MKQSKDVTVYLCTYFDSAAQHGTCACGVFIIMEEGQVYDIHWNGGAGTNNKAEVMALVGLLSICDFLGLQKLHIFGDSKVIIEHALSKHTIRNIHLSGWLNRVEAMWSTRKDSTISHITKNKNQRANALSKQGLSSPQGIWRMQITVDNISHQI